MRSSGGGLPGLKCFHPYLEEGAVVLPTFMELAGGVQETWTPTEGSSFAAANCYQRSQFWGALIYTAGQVSRDCDVVARMGKEVFELPR